MKPGFQQDFKALTVWEVFTDMKETKNNDKTFKAAVKFVAGCVKLLKAGEFEEEATNKSS